MKRKIPEDKYADAKEITRVGTFCLSTLSAWNSDLISYPFDTVKTHLQIQGESNGKTSSQRFRLIGMLKWIVRKGGVFSLYHGLPTMFCRGLLGASMRIVYYDLLRDYFSIKKSDGTIDFPLPRAVLCAAFAGGLAQSLISPLDKVKIQHQTELKRRFEGKPHRSMSMLKHLQDIYAAEGIRGLYKGNSVSTCRALVFTVGDTAGYDLSKRTILMLTGGNETRPKQLLASISAGLYAASLCTPLDVIKTRIMNQPLDEKGKGKLYTGYIDCFIKLVKEDGLLALYKGYTASCLRAGTWCVMFWCTFEQLRYICGYKSF